MKMYRTQGFLLPAEKNKYEEDLGMRYEIKGETLPVVICYLEGGEQMITERGSMS